MSDMYLRTVDPYTRGLKSMLKWFDKAQAFAEAKKFDLDTLANARLAPDMFPLVRQVQIACDGAKGTPARLCGKEPPKHEDSEKTFAELRQRIEKTLTYLATFKPEDFKGCEDRRLPLPGQNQKGYWMHGGEYVTQLATPNFYFHMTTVYALLRHNGVDLGKMDFLGDINRQQG